MYENGANLTNKQANDVLELAIFRGNLECEELALQHGATSVKFPNITCDTSCADSTNCNEGGPKYANIVEKLLGTSIVNDLNLTDDQLLYIYTLA